MLLLPLLWNYYVHFRLDYAVSTTADIKFIFYTILFDTHLIISILLTFPSI